MIELARVERLPEAEAVLRRLDQLADPAHAAFGRRLEEEADKLPGWQKDLASWFRNQALVRFRKAGSIEDGDRLHDRLNPTAQFRKPTPAKLAPPPVDLDALVGQLTDLAQQRRRGAWQKLLRLPENQPLSRQIAERFEALGDQLRDRQEWSSAREFYLVAGTGYSEAKIDFAGVVEKNRDALFALVDARIAAPVDEVPPEPLDWSHGWDRTESLVLAGRFADADALLMRLESVPDDYSLHEWELPGRCELIGDYLLPGHPELARWFLEKSYEAARSMPAETAYEGYTRQGMVDAAAAKVAEANARLPRREATLQAELSGQGQGPRPTPERYTKTVKDGGLLKLIPERNLFMTSGVFGLHRNYFRVRIEGQELRLFPERDESNRVLPFGVEPPAPTSWGGMKILLRLQIGKAVTIYYNVPGGGPAWTLTLTGITAVEPARQ